jgi:hypothetical protein
MAKAKYVNTSTGPKGGYLIHVGKDADGKRTEVHELVMVEPGAEAELDDAPEEWFAKAGTKDAKEAAADDDAK